MDLNDLELIKRTDPERMIDRVKALPDQLAAAWELGKKQTLPRWEGISQVVVSGMGGSAIGADLIAAYIEPFCPVPVIAHRDYNLPAYARDENTLVICASYSGNTEEVLSVFEDTQGQACKVMAITTGGKLGELAKENDIPLWVFEDDFQPRAAVGFSFSLLLAVFTNLGLIPDQSKEIADTVAVMKEKQQALLPEIPDAENPAKRLAGQLVGRWITVWGAGLMAPIARRWKCQINENSKAQASFEVLPEADHNTFQGIYHPEEQFGMTMNIFLRAEHNHPRNQLRDEFTRTGLIVQGQNADVVNARGESRLANMWTSLHFGDYVSCYLAIAYEADPTPVPVLIDLKQKMKAA